MAVFDPQSLLTERSSSGVFFYFISVYTNDVWLLLTLFCINKHKTTCSNSIEHGWDVSLGIAWINLHGMTIDIRRIMFIYREYSRHKDEEKRNNCNEK